MIAEQLPLSAMLPPLNLNDRVRVLADGRTGWIVQVWAGHDHFAVYSVPWRGRFDQGLPVYRRDELEAL